jgi:hyperosmotically inducible periplasmic protein
MNGKASMAGGLVAALMLCAAAQAADGTQMGDRYDPQMATSVDQSNSADAIKVTADIRKAVLGDKTLSTSAHNVKIITTGSTIALRGPVVSTAEKERVVALARQYSSGKDVLDQLTVDGA